MNKRTLATAFVTGALLVSGSAFAANQSGQKAPSQIPNDTTAAPLNQPRSSSAPAPAPAGSSSTSPAGTPSTMQHGSTMPHGSTHSGTATHSGATPTKNDAGMANTPGSNHQSGQSSSKGNAAQPSQPRPVTGG